MIFLRTADATGSTFKILLIASEIIIPLIVFVGAYFIFKPVFDKQEEKAKADDALKKSNEADAGAITDEDDLDAKKDMT